ncbi:hypothetical protein BaRGS_00010313, partial [Batillaria attramentaria]
DLSAFAMPLLESDLQDGIGTMDLDSDQRDGRPRSSSGSSGLKGLITGKNRQRNKSGDDPKQAGSPTSGTTSKVKSFFDTFRPRSKSDVSGLKKPGKKNLSASGMDRSMDESTIQTQLLLQMKPQGDPISPMGQILEGQMLNVPGGDNQDRTRHKSGGAVLNPGMDNFMSKFRARSNSDSRTKGPPRRPLLAQKSLSPPGSPQIGAYDKQGYYGIINKGQQKRRYYAYLTIVGGFVVISLRLCEKPTQTKMESKRVEPGSARSSRDYERLGRRSDRRPVTLGQFRGHDPPVSTRRGALGYCGLTPDSSNYTQTDKAGASAQWGTLIFRFQGTRRTTGVRTCKSQSKILQDSADYFAPRLVFGSYVWTGGADWTQSPRQQKTEQQPRNIDLQGPQDVQTLLSFNYPVSAGPQYCIGSGIGSSYQKPVQSE